MLFILMKFLLWFSDDARDRCIIMSGSTDGSITFWNVTDTIHGFMQLVSEIQPHLSIDCQTRPRTGRGSQGGRRRWRALANHSLKKSNRETFETSLLDGSNLSTPHTAENSSEASGVEESDATNAQNTMLEESDDTSTANIMHTSTQSCDIPEVRPMHMFSGVHQSGVNCLHVSYSTMDGTYHIISGGDDQAIQCFSFTVGSLERWSKDTTRQCSHDNDTLNIVCQHKIPSAHSSAIKGLSLFSMKSSSFIL
jgi:WD repeat-containing protein 6